MRSRVIRAIAVTSILGAVVAGCGSGPSQVGSAVIVGNSSVALSSVESQLGTLLASPKLKQLMTQSGVTPDLVARELVSRSVLHDLIRAEAAETGLVVTDAEVDATIAADDRTTDDNQPATAALESPIAQYGDPALRREAVRDDLLMIELGRRELDRLDVAVQVGQTSSEADAQAKAKDALAGGPAADQFFGGPARAVPASQIVPGFAQAPPYAWSLLGTPQGGVIIVKPQQGDTTWTVAKVQSRTLTDPPPPARGQDAGQSADQVDRALLLTFGTHLLQPRAMATDIRVNPRYGVWDPLSMGVLPADQVPGSVLAPPATTP